MIVPDFRTAPYKHQAREFDLHRYSPARALIWQMRTGKTKAVIDLACHLWKACEIDGVLVAAPNNVHIKWGQEQLPRHSWASVPYCQFSWSTTASHEPGHDEAFEAFLAERRRLRWLMVNHEAFANEHALDYLVRFFRSSWRLMLVVDEVHEFRWATSKRSRALRGLANRCAFKRILSANPLDNTPLHAFAEFEILKQGALGFDRYEDFEAEYGIVEDIYVPGGVGRNDIKRPPRRRPAVVGHKNLEDLRSRIAKWSSLVLRDEVDELPQLILARAEFELRPVQKRLHNDLVEGALARLDSGELIPPAEGGVLVIRLQQIASGFTVDADGVVQDLMKDSENPRLVALLDQARMAPGKFIVWCRFREDVVRAHRFLNAAGIPAVHYYGGTSPADKLKNERRFKTDPKCLALVGQYQAGGQGLDFSEARDIFWYSHTGDLLKRRQADERATRIGGHKVGITDIVAVGSNDLKLLDDLERRRVTSSYMTGEGLRRYLERIV